MLFNIISDNLLDFGVLFERKIKFVFVGQVYVLIVQFMVTKAVTLLNLVSVRAHRREKKNELVLMVFEMSTEP